MTEAVSHLQNVASQLVSACGTEELYERILDAAGGIMQSDLACIQMYYPDREALLLLCHRGFNEKTALQWKWVYPAYRTICAEALRTHRIAVVEDLRAGDFTSEAYDVQGYLEADIRAMQSTPLVSRSGALLGVVSTYWRHPHHLTPVESQGLEILARMAADLIELSQTYDRLRESEERLRFSEIQLKDAQRLARLGSWELNLATGAGDWSDETGRILGLPAGTKPDFSTFLNCVHPRDREKFLACQETIYSTRAPVESEFRIIHSDGEIRFLRSIAEGIGNDQGLLVRIVGATQDITDQVRAQELVRDSETRLKNAERLAHVGHWSGDIRTNRVSWSEEVYRIFGKPLDCVPTFELFFEAVAQHDKDRLKRWLEDFLAGKTGNSCEIQIVRSDGDLRTVACISEVSRDEQGLPVTIFGAIQDITEARRAQKESLEKQKLESLGLLASGIAHDFNNLLASVLAQAELALVHCAAGLPHDGELENIRKAAINGSEIASQLMTYAGKESVSAGVVDLSQVIGDTLHLVRISVPKNIQLQTDLAANLPRVHANNAQIRQIAMNLVMNASDAIGDRAGIIRVTTSFLKAEAGFSEWLSGRDRLCLDVSDTGPGMSPEVQVKVFDPFFTTKSAGHGLGLAVVDGTVRALRGDIRLTSQPGTGTTVQVFLPCDETAAAAISSSAFDSAELNRVRLGITLLIVEDEEMLRRALSILFRRIAVEVFEAADGTSAIEVLHAKGTGIDVMLLDMTLPGASAREIVAEAVKVRPDIKIIFTSAYSQERFEEVMNIPQSHVFVPKPFRVNDFVKTVRTISSS